MARYGVIKEETTERRAGPYYYVWDWFVALHKRRWLDGASGAHQPLTWEAIDAWSRVTATDLATHEIRLLTEIDDIFIEEDRKRINRQTAARTKKK